jgi:hypothetical protein
MDTKRLRQACASFSSGVTRRRVGMSSSRLLALAAHTPTERALLQTAHIADLLMRGGALHHETERQGSDPGDAEEVVERTGRARGQQRRTGGADASRPRP